MEWIGLRKPASQPTSKQASQQVRRVRLNASLIKSLGKNCTRPLSVVGCKLLGCKPAFGKIRGAQDSLYGTKTVNSNSQICSLSTWIEGMTPKTRFWYYLSFTEIKLILSFCLPKDQNKSDVSWAFTKTGTIPENTVTVNVSFRVIFSSRYHI